MDIIQELRNGSVKFKMQEDGSETVEHRPPTATALRAANVIQSLLQQLEGLDRAHKSLIKQYNENLLELEKLNAQRGMVSESMAAEGVDSVRPVHGVSEKPGNEKEIGSTSEAVGSEREGPGSSV